MPNYVVVGSTRVKASTLSVTRAWRHELLSGGGGGMEPLHSKTCSWSHVGSHWLRKLREVGDTNGAVGEGSAC